jgi:hypothetical protein
MDDYAKVPIQARQGTATVNITRNVEQVQQFG